MLHIARWPSRVASLRVQPSYLEVSVSTPSPSTPHSDRREFLAQIATATVALAGTACAAGTAASAADAPPAPAPASRPMAIPPATGNDAWTTRITGKHCAVFDAPEIADGIVVTNAWVYLHSYAGVYGLADRDLSIVLVLRHHGIPMALDDALWEKYEIGRHEQVKDPSTKHWARRNIFWQTSPANGAGAEFTLDALRQRGAIMIGCALAARHFAGELASRTNQSSAAVHDEVRAHLIPGLELAPSGIFAVTRAQEAGCTFVRST